MVNKEALEIEISKSGKSKKYLARKLGITVQELEDKKNGKKDFIAREVLNLLPELKKMDGDKIRAIFFG